MGVYNHFEGKDGLLVAVLNRAFDELRDAMTWDAAVSPLEALLTTGHAYRALALAQPETYRLMFGNKRGADLDDQIAQHAGPAFDGLVDVVRAAQHAQLVRTDDPHAVATIIWSAVHGAVSLEIAGHLFDVDLDAAYARVLELLVEGLRPRSTTRRGEPLRPAAK